MVRLNEFSHENRKIKAKYEFFADSIENISSIIGHSPYHPIENHLSLLQKIEYQYNNNTKKYQSKYIYHYLNNALLKKDDIFLNSKNSADLEAILNKKGDKRIFKDLLKESIPKLKKQLLKKYLLEVHKIIIDDNLSPKNARIIIEYYCNLIVSELLFEGFSRKDVYEIPNFVITGLKENDIRPEYFVKQIKIKERVKTIKTQILRIHTLCYKPKIELFYVFKIENLKVKDDLKYFYNGIQILSPSSNKLRKITPKNIRNDFLAFKGAFAIQKIKVNSVEVGLNEFTSNLKNVLNYYNATYNGLINIKYNDYHIFNEAQKKGVITWKNINMTLSEKNQERFSNSVELKLANKKSSKRVKNLITLDKIYYKAQTETDYSEKIVLYWRYLESLFDYQKDKFPQKEKSSFIISRVPQILVTKEQKHFYDMITIELTNILLNKSFAFGLDKKTARSKFIKNEFELDIDKFKTHEKAKKHLFISRELQKVVNYKKVKELNKAQKFYKSIMFESYEQRNFLVHNCSYFNKSVIKSGLSLAIIITRLRKIIIDSINDQSYSGLTLSQTIEKIALKGNNILTKKENEG